MAEYEKLQAESSDLRVKYEELLEAHQKTCEEVLFHSQMSLGQISVFHVQTLFLKIFFFPFPSCQYHSDALN